MHCSSLYRVELSGHLGEWGRADEPSLPNQLLHLLDVNTDHIQRFSNIIITLSAIICFLLPRFERDRPRALDLNRRLRRWREQSWAKRRRSWLEESEKSACKSWRLCSSSSRNGELSAGNVFTFTFPSYFPSNSYLGQTKRGQVRTKWPNCFWYDHLFSKYLLGVSM